MATFDRDDTGAMQSASVLLFRRADGRSRPIDANAARQLLASIRPVGKPLGGGVTEDWIPLTALKAAGCDLKKWSESGFDKKKDEMGVEYYAAPFVTQDGASVIRAILNEFATDEFQAEFEAKFAQTRSTGTQLGNR